MPALRDIIDAPSSVGSKTEASSSPIAGHKTPEEPSSSSECSLASESDDDSYDVEHIEENRVEDHAMSVASSLARQQRDGTMCDFVISCPEGSIRVHRCIIAAVSEYFKRMCLSSMREAIDQTLHLPNVSLNTLQKLVDFIYTGELDVQVREIRSIFMTAHFLQIDSLTQMCCKVFELTMSEHNVMELFKISERFHTAELRTVALTFIKDNITKLMGRKEFLGGASADVMEDLLQKDDLRVPDEDCVLEILFLWLNYGSQPACNGPRRQFNRWLPERKAQAKRLARQVRFPFLRTRNVGRWERLMGKTTWEILGTDDVLQWKVDDAMFRRRTHAKVHCHFAWESFADEDIILQVTCGDLDGHQNVIGTSISEYLPDIRRMMIRGYKMYTFDMDNPLDLFMIDMRQRAHARGIERTLLQGPAIGDYEYTRNGTIEAMCVNGCGDVFILVQQADYAAICRFDQRNSARNIFEVDDLPSMDCMECYGQDFILAGRALMYIAVEDDRIDDLVSFAPPEVQQELTGMSFISIALRQDTLFVYCKDHQDYERQSFIKSLNLQTGEWGSSIPVFDDPAETDEETLIILRDDLYVLSCNVLPHACWDVAVRKVDEEKKEFVPMRGMFFPGAQLCGALPLDIGVPCEKEIWLAGQCRQFYGNSAYERMALQRLRRLAQ